MLACERLKHSALEKDMLQFVPFRHYMQIFIALYSVHGYSLQTLKWMLIILKQYGIALC
jgi:hypothetical protein